MVGTPKKKIGRKLATFTIIILFIFVLPVSKIPAQTLQNPGILVNEVAFWAPGNFDPATNFYAPDMGVIKLTYEGLLSYTNNSVNILSDSLAYTNYTISPDGLTYTFTVKSGITFSLQTGETVGQPLNAYVMQYSMQRAILMNDPQGGCFYTIDPYIVGASDMMNYGNQTSIDYFLGSQSIHAIDTNHLSITINQNFLGFIQALQFTATYAVSPKAIIDNEPVSYTTNTSDTTFGMISLAQFFPGMTNATILANLGLPSNYDVSNSGVVPNAPANAGAPNEYTWLAEHSAGTGPYVITASNLGIGATLTENPNWWNFASRSGYVNRISTVTFKEISALNTRMTDLKSGTADMADIPYANLSQIIDTNTLQPLYPGIAVHEHNTLNLDFMGFNMWPGNISNTPNIVQSATSNYSVVAGGQANNYQNLKMYTWNYPNGTPQMADPVNPFTALKFRQAFAYAFDYGTFIQNRSAGFGIRMQGAIPKGLVGAQPNLIPNGYIPIFDPVTAKALFQQVGWQGTITFTYRVDSSGDSVSAHVLKNTIESLGVGITINLQSIAWSAYLTNFYNQPLWFFTWQPDYADANDYTVPIYANVTDGGFFSAVENYNNPYVSANVLAGATATSQLGRTTIYTNMERNATQDYPYIYIDQPQSISITRDWIYGIDNPATNSQNPLNAYPNFQFLVKSLTDVNPGPPPDGIGTNETTPSIDSSISFPTSDITTRSSNSSSIQIGIDINDLVQTIGSLSIYIAFPLLIVVYEVRKSNLNKTNFSLKKKGTKSSQEKAVLSDETVNKLEQIIDENKE